MDDLQHENGAVDGLINRINSAKESLNDEARQPVARSPRAQLEQFMATGARMLEAHHNNISQLESSYQMERLRLLDGYRVQIQTLQNECAEAVYKLDRKHRRDTDDAEKLLARLNAIRSFD